MKQESRTIGQSRTWARALCGHLEKTWRPCDTLLAHFQRWDAAVRECRGKPRWYLVRRYRQLSYEAVVLKRDKALRDLLGQGT